MRRLSSSQAAARSVRACLRYTAVDSFFSPGSRRLEATIDSYSSGSYRSCGLGIHRLQRNCKRRNNQWMGAILASRRSEEATALV